MLAITYPGFEPAPPVDHISGLPKEMIKYIFNFLKPRDLERAAKVSKLFYQVVVEAYISNFKSHLHRSLTAKPVLTADYEPATERRLEAVNGILAGKPEFQHLSLDANVDELARLLTEELEKVLEKDFLNILNEKVIENTINQLREPQKSADIPGSLQKVLERIQAQLIPMAEALSYADEEYLKKAIKALKANHSYALSSFCQDLPVLALLEKKVAECQISSLAAVDQLNTNPNDQDAITSILEDNNRMILIGAKIASLGYLDKALELPSRMVRPHLRHINHTLMSIGYCAVKQTRSDIAAEIVKHLESSLPEKKPSDIDFYQWFDCVEELFDKLFLSQSWVSPPTSYYSLFYIIGANNRLRELMKNFKMTMAFAGMFTKPSIRDRFYSDIISSLAALRPMESFQELQDQLEDDSLSQDEKDFAWIIQVSSNFSSRPDFASIERAVKSALHIKDLELRKQAFRAIATLIDKRGMSDLDEASKKEIQARLRSSNGETIEFSRLLEAKLALVNVTEKVSNFFRSRPSFGYVLMAIGIVGMTISYGIWYHSSDDPVSESIKEQLRAVDRVVLRWLGFA